MVSVYFSLLRPGAIVFLVFIFFGVELALQSQIEILLQTPAATNIALATLVLVTTIFVLARTPSKIWPTSNQWLALGLYAYAGLSLAWSPGFAYLNTGLLLVLPISALNLFLVPLIFQTQRSYAEIRSGFLLYSFLCLVLLIFLVEWQHRFLVSSGGVVFGNPLELSSLGGVVFVVGIVYFVKYKSSRWITLTVCALALIMLFVAASRGQILAAAVAALCGGAWASGRGNVAVVAVFSGIMLFSLVMLDAVLNGALTNGLLDVVSYSGLFDAAKLDRFQGTSVEQGASIRLTSIGVMLSAWWSDPFAILFGLGNSAAYDPELLGIYPHNVPVEILTEEGIFGFLIFATFIFRVLRIPLGQSGPNKRRILQDAAPFLAIFVFYLIVSLKQGNLVSSSLVFLAGILSERSVILSRQELAKENANMGNANKNTRTQ